MHTNITWLRNCVSAVALAALMTPLLAGPAQANSVWNYIEGSASDAEERASGAVDTKESVIELGYERGRQTIGLRYTLGIPQGSKINSAKLLMQAAKASSGSTSLVIRAQDTDNAPAFTQSNRNISGRTKTSASVKWSPAVAKTNAGLTSPNIASVIQEVVNRAGFKAANEVAIIISTTGGTGARPVYSLDGSGKAPILIVEYTPAKGGSKPATPKPPKGDGGGSEEVPVEDDGTDLAPTSGAGRVPISSPLNKQVIDAMTRAKNGPTTNGQNNESPMAWAMSGDVYLMGRMLNQHVTGLMTAYDHTRDPRYLEEVARYMAIIKSHLKDTDKDGYRNWVYKRTVGDGTGFDYRGTDKHEMEELLMHGWVADAAAFLKISGGSKYAKEVAFWTDYLKNDYEAKWRKRKGRPTGMVLSTYPLFHPYVNFTRYYTGMAILTGNPAYLAEAKKRAAVIENQFIPVKTKKGTAYEWKHFLGKTGACAPIPYTNFTIQMLERLHAKGLLSTASMAKVALNVSQQLIGSNLKTAANSCGTPATAKYGIDSARITQNGMYFLARFDPSGDSQKKLDQAWKKANRGIGWGLGLQVAMMLKSLGR